MNEVARRRTVSVWLLTGCGVWTVMGGFITGTGVLTRFLLVPVLAWLGAFVLQRAGR